MLSVSLLSPLEILNGPRAVWFKYCYCVSGRQGKVISFSSLQTVTTKYGMRELVTWE